MDIVSRVKNILVTPQTEWPVIDAEPSSVESIYRDYVIYLAAIPAIASFIGMSLVGFSVPVLGTVRVGLFAGLFGAVVSFAMQLVGVYVLALITDYLAPNFSGQKNFLNALKLAAYSLTAAWLAGIFAILPALSILGILGLYSFYLFYVGLPVLMKSPQDKTLLYAGAILVAGIVVNLLIGLIVGLVVRV